MGSLVKYYFESDSNKNKLLQELESWRGTPYRHRCAVKGVGADCVGFVLAAYKNAGAIKIGNSTIPKYHIYWNYHEKEERLYNEFKVRRKRSFREVSMPELTDGDLIMFRLGGVVGHCGIVFEDYIYQAVSIIGVEKINRMDSYWNGRKRCAFRVVK